MAEKIIVYNLNDKNKPISMDRDRFYNEQVSVFEENGKPTMACELIQILLFTLDKEIILQKRSIDKSHNPGLIDKTIGGHVTYGFSPTYAVMSETLQELHIPSFVLDAKEDFEKTFKLLQKYLDRSALVQYIESDFDDFQKVFNKKKVNIANRYHFYFGIYNGPIKPVDKEASGVLFYKWDALEKEISLTPEIFTYDLKYFLSRYKKKIQEFLKILDD